MKAIILLALVGLCWAGGIPVSSDYSISTHGPDRSFTLVHKSRLPEIMTGHDKMLLTDARAFDLGLDAKKAFLGDVSLAGSPLMARAWTPKAAYADPRMDVALAKGLAGCIGCEAPTVSTVVTRTVHKPELAIEKRLIAPLGLEKVMLADKLDKEIAERALVNSILARKVMADPLGVRMEKDLTDKLIADKLIADKLWADKFAIAAPLALAGKSVFTEPSHLRWMGEKAVLDARALRHDSWLHDKTLLAPKLVASYADKDLHDARALALANKDLLDARAFALAGKDLLDARTLAFDNKDLLGLKTMLIKK